MARLSRTSPHPADTIWNLVDDRLRLGIRLDDQPVVADGATRLTLPSDTFVHDDPFAVITVEASLADGSPLPEFVAYDSNSQTFVVDGETAAELGIAEINVQVVGSDNEGQSAVGGFRIEVLGVDGVAVGLQSPEPTADRDGFVGRAIEEEPERETDPEASVLPSDLSGDVEQPAANQEVIRLTIALDDQQVFSDSASTIALPSNTFEHLDPEARLIVEATLDDGSPLPEFVVFDPDSMTFEVDGVAAAAAGFDQVVVLITARDEAGNTANGMFVIEIVAPETAKKGAEQVDGGSERLPADAGELRQVALEGPESAVSADSTVPLEEDAEGAEKSRFTTERGFEVYFRRQNSAITRRY